MNGNHFIFICDIRFNLLLNLGDPICLKIAHLYATALGSDILDILQNDSFKRMAQKIGLSNRDVDNSDQSRMYNMQDVCENNNSNKKMGRLF